MRPFCLSAELTLGQLSPQERCELEALLHPHEDDAWDRQMKSDAKAGGKLHRLMQTSQKKAKAGKLVVFPTCEPE